MFVVRTGVDRAPGSAAPLRALVVHEPAPHPTEAIARAVARGLRLEGLDTTTVVLAEAPVLAHVAADLLVVGFPARAFALPRPETGPLVAGRDRRDPRGVRPAAGLRDWLVAGRSASVERRPRVAAFVARVRPPVDPPASAAARGHHVLRHLGYPVVDAPRGFQVEGAGGLLLEQELGHAVAWGRDLGRACHRRVADRAVASGGG